MSNYDQIEERLFILLDTVEKATAENAELRAEVSKLTTKIGEQNRELVNTANQKIRKLEMTQDDFNNIVFQAVLKGVEHTVAKDIRNISSSAIHQVIEESSEGINRMFNQTERNLKKIGQEYESSLNKINMFNLKKSTEVAREVEAQKEKLSKEYFKTIGIIAGGIFFLMCVFILIFWLVAVPSEGEIRRLEKQKTQLYHHIDTLKNNRDEWIRDAQRNGYPTN